MSYRRNGLRKQVTEAKEGPLELRKEKERQGKCAWGEAVGKGVGMLHRDQFIYSKSSLSESEVECTIDTFALSLRLSTVVLSY